MAHGGGGGGHGGGHSGGHGSGHRSGGHPGHTNRGGQNQYTPGGWPGQPGNSNPWPGPSGNQNPWPGPVGPSRWNRWSGYSGGYNRRGRSAGVSIAVAVVVLVVLGIIGAHKSHTDNSPINLNTPTFNTGQLTQVEHSLGYDTYSGTSDKGLGTIKLSQPSKVQWFCASCDESGGFVMTSNGTDGGSGLHVSNLKGYMGTITVPAGTYDNVQINSHGQDWNILIMPVNG